MFWVQFYSYLVTEATTTITMNTSKRIATIASYSRSKYTSA